MDQVGILAGVSDEEDRGVEKDPIQVALFCPQFDSETMGITSSIGRTRLATDGGETDGGGNLLADFVEKGLGCDVAQVVGDFEFTISTGTFGMALRSSMHEPNQVPIGVNETYKMLGDTLASHVRESFDMMEVCVVREQTDRYWL